jgi:hypothetical protein
MAACLTVLAAIVASGCGGGDSSENRAQARADCEAQIGPLLTSLQSLGSRLDIGLSYSEYGDAVGDAKVAYDRIDPKSAVLADSESQEGRACRGAALSLEGAMNRHYAAVQQWHNCVFDDYSDCTLDAIEDQLRNKWRRADSQVAGAEKRLDDISQE